MNSKGIGQGWVIAQKITNQFSDEINFKNVA